MEALRIVLLGKKGAGKSASGNTLLGRKVFHTVPSSQRVTKACSMGLATVDGQKLCVVDTPGWFDTIMTKAESIEEIVTCLDLSDPGLHVLFLVLPIGRFTKEEINTVKEIMEVFGDEACKYMMVLFTKGDDLGEGTIEDFLQTVHPDLKKIIDVCEGRSHVFNNKDQNNHMQVSTLLQKIKDTVKKNGGKRYTKDMYEKTRKQTDTKQELENTVKRLIQEKYASKLEPTAKSREDEKQKNNEDLKNKHDSGKKSQHQQLEQNKCKDFQRDMEIKHQKMMQRIETLEKEVHELKQKEQQHSEEINRLRSKQSESKEHQSCGVVKQA